MCLVKKVLTHEIGFVIKRGSLSGNNSVVECDLAKVEVAGSNPVSRSKEFKGLANWLNPFFLSKFPVHPFLHPFDIG